MARKKSPLENIECINKHTCIFKETNQQQLLSELKTDHEDFKKAIVSFTENSHDIKTNTKHMAETLALFKEDSKEHLKIIADSNQIIAGRRQVPLPIFIIIVGMLCGLLLASEVRYNGVNIDISWDGIKITNTTPAKIVH